MLGDTFGGEQPKSLEHNTEFGLSLHLSTRLLHWMWAQGGTLQVDCKEEIAFKLSWTQFLISKKLLYANFFRAIILNKVKIALRKVIFSNLISNDFGANGISASAPQPL